MKRIAASVRLVPCVVLALLPLALSPAAAQEEDGAAPRPVSPPAAPEGASEGAAGQSTEGSTEGSTGSAPAPRRLIEAIRAVYPDLVAAARDGRELAARLLEAAGGKEVIEIGGGRSANVKLLAARLYAAIGDGTRARKLWLEVSRSASRAEDRVEGMFSIGLHYFLRERYADAWKYWRLVPRMAPDSKWAKHVARYEPLLRIAVALRQRERALEEAAGEKRAVSPEDLPPYPPAPDFAGEFGALGKMTKEDLLGDWVLIDFWSSTAPGARKAAVGLRQTVLRARRQGWRGIVLGVNLDTSREAFERALEEWVVSEPDPQTGDEARVAILRSWPQHFDGLGFESPLARAFGIPRTPMRVVIDPRGNVVWISRPRSKRTPLRRTLARVLSDATATGGRGKKAGEKKAGGKKAGGKK